MGICVPCFGTGGGEDEGYDRYFFDRLPAESEVVERDRSIWTGFVVIRFAL